MKAKRLDSPTSIGLLVLRLGAGGLMLTHGWGKAKMLLAGDFENFGDPIGLGNVLSLVLAAGAEFGCSLLVILGLGTRVAAVPLVFTMVVAAFVVHGKDPWTMEQAFKVFMAGGSQFPVSREPALLFLVPFLALAFTGPGRFSLDAVLRARAKRKGGA